MNQCVVVTNTKEKNNVGAGPKVRPKIKLFIKMQKSIVKIKFIDIILI